MRYLLEIQEKNAYASVLLDILIWSSETGVDLRFKIGEVPTHEEANAVSQWSLTQGKNGGGIGSTDTEALYRWDTGRWGLPSKVDWGVVCRLGGKQGGHYFLKPTEEGISRRRCISIAGFILGWTQANSLLTTLFNSTQSSRLSS